MSKIDLTRKELYDLVWDKPLSYIIEVYGGSYQEVKEMLKKYSIPSPENGYWSKLRAGYQIPKTPLPNIGDESEKVIYDPKKKKKRAEQTTEKQYVQLSTKYD